MNESMNTNREALLKWLGILFYVHAASLIFTVINVLTSLDTVTGWLSKALSVVTIYALFQLQSTNPRYRKAAIFYAITLASGLALNLINSLSTGLIVVTLAASVCSMIAAYQEYHGHSEVVEELDQKLARKWGSLFGLSILLGLGTSFASMIASLLLVSAELDTKIVSTIIAVLTVGINCLLDVLYLSYITKTRRLLEN